LRPEVVVVRGVVSVRVVVDVEVDDDVAGVPMGSVETRATGSAAPVREPPAARWTPKARSAGTASAARTISAVRKLRIPANVAAASQRLGQTWVKKR
jgi:hypothetical protein